jgi:hypothetical protein
MLDMFFQPIAFRVAVQDKEVQIKGVTDVEFKSGKLRANTGIDGQSR